MSNAATEQTGSTDAPKKKLSIRRFVEPTNDATEVSFRATTAGLVIGGLTLILAVFTPGASMDLRSLATVFVVSYAIAFTFSISSGLGRLKKRQAQLERHPLLQVTEPPTTTAWFIRRMLDLSLTLIVIPVCLPSAFQEGPVFNLMTLGILGIVVFGLWLVFNNESHRQSQEPATEPESPSSV